jgi:predicted  nucleic acid-binding Zn-ribbon protein
MYKEYEYGAYRKEMREILRRRLVVNDKLRHHKKKIERWEAELKGLEAELAHYEEKVKRGF